MYGLVFVECVWCVDSVVGGLVCVAVCGRGMCGNRNAEISSKPVAGLVELQWLVLWIS